MSCACDSTGGPKNGLDVTRPFTVFFRLALNNAGHANVGEAWSEAYSFGAANSVSVIMAATYLVDATVGLDLEASDDAVNWSVVNQLLTLSGIGEVGGSQEQVLRRLLRFRAYLKDEGVAVVSVVGKIYVA